MVIPLRKKILVFIFTFLSYAGLHILREGWSYSKPMLRDAFGVDDASFGIVDTLYLICYSLGLATIGNLTRKVPLTWFLSIGMVTASLCYMSFSLYYIMSSGFSFPMVVVFMSLNGIFQSTGWPGAMSIFSNWFGKEKKGLLLGFWSINSNVGNIIAAVLCNILEVEAGLSWVYNFIITGGITITFAIMVVSILEDKPKQVQSISESVYQPLQPDSFLTTKDEIRIQQQQQSLKDKNIIGKNNHKENQERKRKIGKKAGKNNNQAANSQQRTQEKANNNKQSSNSQRRSSPKRQRSDQQIKQNQIKQSYGKIKQSEDEIKEKQQIKKQPGQKKLNVFTALLVPMVPFYALGYAGIKGCVYGLLFWLPTYLDDRGVGSEKGYITAMIDVGTFVGAVTLGYFSDRFSYKAIYMSPMIFMGALLMLCVSFLLTQDWQYCIAMLLIGIMVGGPYGIIGTVVAVDLGKSVGPDNVGVVTALLEGVASFFAAISQLVIGQLPFEAIFYLFCGECLLSAAVLMPLFLQELRVYRQKRK